MVIGKKKDLIWKSFELKEIPGKVRLRAELLNVKNARSKWLG